MLNNGFPNSYLNMTPSTWNGNTNSYLVEPNDFRSNNPDDCHTMNHMKIFFNNQPFPNITNANEQNEKLSQEKSELNCLNSYRFKPMVPVNNFHLKSNAFSDKIMPANKPVKCFHELFIDQWNPPSNHPIYQNKVTKEMQNDVKSNNLFVLKFYESECNTSNYNDQSLSVTSLKNLNASQQFKNQFQDMGVELLSEELKESENRLSESQTKIKLERSTSLPTRLTTTNSQKSNYSVISNSVVVSRAQIKSKYSKTTVKSAQDKPLYKNFSNVKTASQIVISKHDQQQCEQKSQTSLQNTSKNNENFENSSGSHSNNKKPRSQSLISKIKCFSGDDCNMLDNCGDAVEGARERDDDNDEANDETRYDKQSLYKSFYKSSIFNQSIFVKVPPTIRFVSEPRELECKDFKKLMKVLKWRLSPITPIVVRNIVLNSGFKFTNKSNVWLGTWDRNMKAPLFKTIKEYQKFNHFPAIYQIGRKDYLHRNISKMAFIHGSSEFGFTPQTFILPGGLKEFVKAWKDNSCKKWIIKPVNRNCQHRHGGPA